MRLNLTLSFRNLRSRPCDNLPLFLFRMYAIFAPVRAGWSFCPAKSRPFLQCRPTRQPQHAKSFYLISCPQLAGGYFQSEEFRTVEILKGRKVVLPDKPIFPLPLEPPK